MFEASRIFDVRKVVGIGSVCSYPKYTEEDLWLGHPADAVVLATERYDSPDPVNIGSATEASIGIWKSAVRFGSDDASEATVDRLAFDMVLKPPFEHQERPQ